MNFYTGIVKLYSNNTSDILEVLNNAIHISTSMTDGIHTGIHTGFYCETHKKTTLELVFCIDNGIFYYQKASNQICVLGTKLFLDFSFAYRCFIIANKVLKQNNISQIYDYNANRFPYYWFRSFNTTNQEYKIEKVINEIYIDKTKFNFQFELQLESLNQSRTFDFFKPEGIHSIYLNRPKVNTYKLGSKGFMQTNS